MEFSQDELIALVVQLRAELKAAHERIAELEQQVEHFRKQPPGFGPNQEYSLKAEEQRREKTSGQRRK